jgi:replication factor C large subunit
MSFVQKYKPKNLKEFVNQKEAVDVFLKWINKWKPGSKALLFHGIPGVGKTALIEAYTGEKSFEFIEMNASDFRSAQQIQEVLGQSMKQSPLFKKSKIFLIDEIDGIAGREDLGGVGAVIKIVKESRFPVILTANDPWNQRLRTLREYCDLVEFKKISIWDIERRLKEICEKEKIKFDQEVLKQLARESKGDLRSAINDLESISQGKKTIVASDAEQIGFREREINIFEVMRNIFKTKNALAAKLTVGDSDKDPDEIFWWIENNITNEYEKPEEIARAFDLLSKADIFRQRISSRQNWRLKAYMIDLMSAGVATAKKEMYRKFTRYQYPRNIMILGRTKKGRAVAKGVLGKISTQLHCSTRKTREEFLPFIRVMIKNPSFKREFIQKFEIEKDDLKTLLKL